MKFVITGGHHSSALPLINLIKADFPDITIYWFGHRFSMLEDKNPTLEFREITKLGLPFYNIHAGKLYKTYNLQHIIRIPFGFFQSLVLLIKLKPDVIISFGGYLAVPVVLSGWLLGIPSVTHEQTVVAGYANKFVSKFVKKIFISWKESAKFFPPNKTIFTGMPLRSEIFSATSASFNGQNSLPYIYVTAGKTGSHFINELILDILKDLLSISNVILQCGDHSQYNDYENILREYDRVKTSVSGKLFLRKFILGDEIGEAYDKCTVVVSRAGAHTVAEIIALKKYALLIPISWVSHNEQRLNATMVSKLGLGKILDENTLTSAELLQAILEALTKSKGITHNFKESDVSLLLVSSRSTAEIILNETLKLLRKK